MRPRTLEDGHGRRWWPAIRRTLSQPLPKPPAQLIRAKPRKKRKR